MFKSQVEKIDKIREIVDVCLYAQPLGEEKYKAAIFLIEDVLDAEIVTFP
jgi:hypothetical protein